jgi:hypothetical protein
VDYGGDLSFAIAIGSGLAADAISIAVEAVRVEIRDGAHHLEPSPLAPVAG